MDKRLTEKRLETKKIFDGEILKLYFDRVQLPNGKTATREKVMHPGAVGIIPVNDDRNILLVKQYRYPVEEITIEIPAGKIDSGEEPEKCAWRELGEEVGATGGDIKLLASFFTTPGFSNEIMHLFIATGFKRTDNDLDEDEFLEIVEVGLEEAVGWIREGIIKDSKTIIGILMARDFLDNGKQ